MPPHHLVFVTLLRYTPRRPGGRACSSPPEGFETLRRPRAARGREEERMSSVVKKRRKKMRKHKHRKMLKKTRWQRKHKG